MRKAIIQRPLLKDQLKCAACFPMSFRALTRGQKFPHPLLCALPRGKDPRHHLAPATMKENMEVAATNHSRETWEFKVPQGYNLKGYEYSISKKEGGRKEGKRRLPRWGQSRGLLPCQGHWNHGRPGHEKCRSLS